MDPSVGDLVQQYLAAGIKLRNYLHARQVPQVTLMVVEATVGLIQAVKK